WLDQLEACLGMLDDPTATSPSSCAARCCSDVRCEVWQYSSLLGSCVRGSPSPSMCLTGLLDKSAGGRRAPQLLRSLPAADANKPDAVGLALWAGAAGAALLVGVLAFWGRKGGVLFFARNVGVLAFWRRGGAGLGRGTVVPVVSDPAARRGLGETAETCGESPVAADTATLLLLHALGISEEKVGEEAGEREERGRVWTILGDGVVK
ncbi:MAG: hypothetical protein SGPRY_011164, partial [Prymnesium sp.]